MEAAKQLFHPSSMSALIDEVFSFYCSIHLVNKTPFFTGSFLSVFFSFLFSLPQVIYNAQVWEEMVLIQLDILKIQN